MSQSKKVVLFLVEGVTDETALGLVLSKIIEKKKVVRFKIVGGDITTHAGTNISNCINRVVAQVKEFLTQDFYQKGDLEEIIHLVDLDGVFVPENAVVENTADLANGTHVYYTEDQILTDHVDSIRQRNQQKSEVLRKLIQQHEIYGKVPYQVYFFSCNLEHVFYDEQNAMKENKYDMAKQLVERYVNDPDQLVQFMNDRKIAMTQDYETSWKAIEQDTQSLKRHSNFHLFLNQW